MKNALIALGALSLAAPAMAQTVDVGRANWRNMPRAAVNEANVDYTVLATEVARLMENNECKLGGSRAGKLDVNVPYAVQSEANGRLSRVLVGETGCAPLEALVGATVISLADDGMLKAGDPGRWYAGEINFALE